MTTAQDNIERINAVMEDPASPDWLVATLTYHMLRHPHEAACDPDILSLLPVQQPIGRHMTRRTCARIALAALLTILFLFAGAAFGFVEIMVVMLFLLVPVAVFALIGLSFGD